MHDLESHRLEVVLGPPPQREAASGFRQVRLVLDTNPRWYQKLCAQYPSSRRDRNLWREPKTLIKRRRTLDALLSIARGTPHKGPYIERLMPYVKRHASTLAAEQRAAREDLAATVPF